MFPRSPDLRPSVALFACTLLTATTAFADDGPEADEAHVDVGGAVSAGVLSDDHSTAALDLGRVDVAYRIKPWLRVGPYFQSAISASTSPGDDCGDGGYCFESITGVGVAAQLHPISRRWYDPWFGLGWGALSIVHTEPSSDSGSSVTKHDWYSAVDVSLGFNFVSRPISIGPCYTAFVSPNGQLGGLRVSIEI